MRQIRLGVVVALAAAGGSQAVAQSRAPFSVQASGEYVVPTKDYGPGLASDATLGWEAQLRYTSGRVSVGVGYQRTTVFRSAAADVTGLLSLGFVEPRYVIAVLGESVAPYLAARMAYGELRISGTSGRSAQSSATFGGGAGLLIAASPRIAVDLGGQYFVADFRGSSGNAGYFLVRAGVAVGLF